MKQKHYNGTEIIDFIYQQELDFCQGNVIKYVCRYHKKNGVEDIDKAIHYLKILREKYEETTRDSS